MNEYIKVNSGEITPELDARDDLVRDKGFCRHVENFIPQIYGNVERRPGTKKVYNTSTVGNPYLTYHRAYFVGEYPTLRATTAQADPGLTHTLAISDVTDLQNMSNNKAGNYYLTGDIDASATETWNGGQGFTPIGSLTTPFTGTLDGCGYTITGLHSKRETDYRGLLGYCQGVKVANLTLADVDISGDDYIGALAGWMQATAADYCLVQNCHVTSGTVAFWSSAGASTVIGGLIGHTDISVITDEWIYIYDCSAACTVTSSTRSIPQLMGGLVGDLEHTVISNCYATGDVNGSNEALVVGGCIGSAGTTSIITYCYATGDVTGEETCGGFIGQTVTGALGGCTIDKCYSTGNVSASTSGTPTDFIGGFIGHPYGQTITDCYAWGNVSTAETGARVGGFCGADDTSSGTFTNCYCIGLVTGDSPGGFIEEGAIDTTYTACFWDTETSGTETSDGGVGHLTLWMKTKPNYTGAGWDFETIWYMPWEEA